MHMRLIVICGLPGCAIYFYIIVNGTILEKEIEHKMCVDFLYSVCMKHFPFREDLSAIWLKIGLLIKYPLFLSEFNETWTSLALFCFSGPYLYSCVYDPVKISCGHGHESSADSCVTGGRILSLEWFLFTELCCVRASACFTCINMSSAAVVTWFLFPFQVSEVVPLSVRLP